MLERRDGGKFLFLVNWDHRDATVDLGVRMRPGTYQVTKYSLASRSEAKLGDAAGISAGSLTSFRTELNGHEAAALTILP